MGIKLLYFILSAPENTLPLLSSQSSSSCFPMVFKLCSPWSPTSLPPLFSLSYLSSQATSHKNSPQSFLLKLSLLKKMLSNPPYLLTLSATFFLWLPLLSVTSPASLLLKPSSHQLIHNTSPKKNALQPPSISL